MKGGDWEGGREGPEAALRKRGRKKNGETKGREGLARKLSSLAPPAGGRRTFKTMGNGSG